MCVYLYINCFYTTYICKLFFCESSRFAHLPFTFSFSLFAEKTFIAPPYQKNSLKTKLRKKSKIQPNVKEEEKKTTFSIFGCNDVYSSHYTYCVLLYYWIYYYDSSSLI